MPSRCSWGAPRGRRGTFGRGAARCPRGSTRATRRAAGGRSPPSPPPAAACDRHRTHHQNNREYAPCAAPITRAVDGRLAKKWPKNCAENSKRIAYRIYGAAPARCRRGTQQRRSVRRPRRRRARPSTAMVITRTSHCESTVRGTGCGCTDHQQVVLAAAAGHLRQHQDVALRRRRRRRWRRQHTSNGIHPTRPRPAASAWPGPVTRVPPRRRDPGISSAEAACYTILSIL